MRLLQASITAFLGLGVSGLAAKPATGVYLAQNTQYSAVSSSGPAAVLTVFVPAGNWLVSASAVMTSPNADVVGACSITNFLPAATLAQTVVSVGPSSSPFAAVSLVGAVQETRATSIFLTCENRTGSGAGLYLNPYATLMVTKAPGGISATTD